MLKQRHGLGGIASTNQQFANGGGEAITIQDADGYICMSISTALPLRLTAEQARYLADQLHEAAGRLELQQDQL